MTSASPEIYTLSLHDALPIYRRRSARDRAHAPAARRRSAGAGRHARAPRRVAQASAGGNAARNRVRSASCADRSEEHTSELQSQFHLVCRLLLEKKNKQSPTV